MTTEELNGVPATREHPDEAYGIDGLYYYHWPALKAVFRADWKGHKFKDETEELTLLEFVELRIKYNRDRAALGNNFQLVREQGRYYYYDGMGDVFGSIRQLNEISDDVVEIRREEYITLSILKGQNLEDTLV